MNWSAELVALVPPVRAPTSMMEEFEDVPPMVAEPETVSEPLPIDPPRPGVVSGRQQERP